MDLENIYTGFFSSTYTQADARRRLNILDIVFEESSYRTGVQSSPLELLKTKQMSEEDRLVLVNFLSSAKLPQNTTDLKKIFTGLKEEILRRPVATLTLPFEPTTEQISSYGKWFRENVHPKALLTIVFSARVIGGCAITWQGKEVTYDLEYLLKAKRNSILAVVDAYVEKVKHEKVI
jgi:hypothetical protein